LFLDVLITNNNFFARYNDCVSITNKIRATTDPTEVEWLWVIQMTHNNYISCYHNVYYAHKLKLEKNPSTYLSIAYDKMDRENTFISRLGKKEKDYSRFMNLPISLASMFAHGHKNRDFSHFILLFMEMGSSFTIASIYKCLK